MLCCRVSNILVIGDDADSFVLTRSHNYLVDRALESLGANVVQVSTGSPSHKSRSKIEVMSPAVGELDLGFADVIGEFDSLLDCMSDEARLRSGMQIRDSDNLDELVSSGVVAELRKQHKCSW